MPLGIKDFDYFHSRSPYVQLLTLMSNALTIQRCVIFIYFFMSPLSYTGYCYFRVFARSRLMRRILVDRLATPVVLNKGAANIIFIVGSFLNNR